MEFSSVQFIVLGCTKNKKFNYLKLMVRKPKGSHLAYKEWAPSVKLSQQNIIRISYGTYNVCRVS